MTRGEAVNWIINISADIGKAEHRELWHYEQALSEIREMLESEPERKKGKWLRFGEDGNPNEDDTVFWQCDQCLETYTGRTTRIPNFCPNCGADMRKPMAIPEDIINSVLGYDD